LTVNLIDSYGIGGKLGLTNTNGSYLFTNTRTELKVIDNTLIFTFTPSIAPSPVDPIDPIPNPAPLPDTVTLDPQTITISQAGSANVAFVAQGLDLIT
ncbi:MAG: hypothetical protein LBD57_01820, partial [Endomicrobium sp.]|uniref:hypothetical protein n=1 Tax=Candidatus Endomicrobiellum cubanum TaxID=3242325 RepID=UPI002826C682|nr:hypothetical protein [Endomicrobium sp.]